MSGNRPLTTLVLALPVATRVTGCGTAQSHGAGTPAAGQPAKPGVTAAATPPAGNVTGRTTPAADRDRPADQAVRARAAGLDLLAAEDLTVQCHAHLDVIVDGRSVPVPAGLGISVPDANGTIPSHEPGQPGIALRGDPRPRVWGGSVELSGDPARCRRRALAELRGEHLVTQLPGTPAGSTPLPPRSPRVWSRLPAIGVWGQSCRTRSRATSSSWPLARPSFART